MNKEDKNSNFANRILKCLICLAVVILYTIIIIIIVNWCVNKKSKPSIDKEYIDNITAEICNIHEKYSLDNTIDNKQCSEMMIAGYAAGFGDKYGGYLTPEEFVEHSNKDNAKVCGIGILAHGEDKGVYIVKVYDNSPAEEAGIVEGDLIISVNGIKYNKTDYDEFMKSIRGEAGTSVHIGILRDNKELELRLIRAEVDTPTIECTEIDNGLYLKINTFGFGTDEEFIDIISNYDFSNKGLIIDLRNNPGGVLDSVIRMADFVVPKGLMLEVQSRESSKKYHSDSKELNIPIVILVNNVTASASEIFSQVLKDFNKAVIVGETTFGKGTVLSEYKLSNGGAFITSIGKYYTKSGICVEGIGVEPDVPIELSAEHREIYYKLKPNQDEQYIEAYKKLRSLIESNK